MLINRPINEFAGWLKIFQIIVYINLVFAVLLVFIGVGEIFTGSEKLITLLGFLENGITLYILASILKIVLIRDPAIPERITDLIFYLFLLALGYGTVYTVITTGFKSSNWTDMNNAALFAAFQKMLWSMIWRSYFLQSKRVSAYYSSGQIQEHNNDSASDT